MIYRSMIGIVAMSVATFAVAQNADDATRQDQQPGRITIRGDADDASDRSAVGQTQRDATGAARQAGDRGMMGRDNQKQPEPQEIVDHLASSNKFEIELSRLAQQKAQDPQLKQFAQQMIQDHTQAQQQVRQVAEQKDLKFNDRLQPAHQAKLDELKKMEGADFDRAFSICQAGHHVEAVLMHQYLANEYQDPQVQQMARQLLPQLQQHQQHAMQMAQVQVGGPGAAIQAGSRLDGSDNMNRSDTNRNGLDRDGMNRDMDRDGMNRSGGMDRSSPNTPGPGDRSQQRQGSQPGGTGGTVGGQ